MQPSTVLYVPAGYMLCESAGKAANFGVRLSLNAWFGESSKTAVEDMEAIASLLSAGVAKISLEAFLASKMAAMMRRLCDADARGGVAAEKHGGDRDAASASEGAGKEPPAVEKKDGGDSGASDGGGKEPPAVVEKNDGGDSGASEGGGKEPPAAAAESQEEQCPNAEALQIVDKVLQAEGEADEEKPPPPAPPAGQGTNNGVAEGEETAPAPAESGPDVQAANSKPAAAKASAKAGAALAKAAGQGRGGRGRGRKS